MTVTLTPEQMKWIEEAVAAGQFSSVEEAVRVAVDGLIVTAKFDDLAWTQPYIDEAREEVVKGKVIAGDEFIAWLDDKAKSLRGR